MKIRPRHVVSFLVSVVALAYFGLQVSKSWPQLSAIAWQGFLPLALVSAVLLQTACTLVDGWFWGLLLRQLGVLASSRIATSVFSVSQFAKYLPGNIGQHVGRIALAKQAGWQTGRIVVSLLAENGFGIGAGGLVAAGGIAFAGAGALAPSRMVLATAVLVLGWLFGVFALKRILARPPAQVAKWLSLEGPVELGVPFLVLYLGSHVLSYAGGFVSFTAIVCGLIGHFPHGAWKIPAAVSASWLAGYLVPGAPAGLGVREATLTALLGSSLGTGTVVSAALIWRFSALLADALVLLVGFGLRRADGQSPSLT